MKNFQPILVGIMETARSKFRIDQVKAEGSCKITDMRTGNSSYAGSIAKAWSSVRYQCNIRPDTHNSHGWPKNDCKYPKGY